MLQLTRLILFTALVAGAFSYEGLTMGDLPPEVAKQLEEILKNPFLNLKPDCSEPPNPEIHYWLYTRENRDNPIHLDPNNPSQVDARRKILLIVPGWLSNSTVPSIQKLKNAYLDRYNSHIIIVDWYKSALQLYTTSYCHVPYIGDNLANFLCLLNEKFKVRLYMVNAIGHTMGAQVLGYVGQYLDMKCKQQLARITGLDPSGPLYKYQPEAQRLDPSDAEFVDVIHTDAMKMGYGPNCGDADFHVNCANPQPGCPSLHNLNNDTLVSDALCSSHRSLEYMIEGVASEDFIGVSCGRCPNYCNPDIINEVYATMGENYKPVTPPAHKHLYFIVPTNKTSPYAKGWDPYTLRVNKTVLCENAAESPFVFLRKVCNVPLKPLDL